MACHAVEPTNNGSKIAIDDARGRSGRSANHLVRRCAGIGTGENKRGRSDRVLWCDAPPFGLTLFRQTHNVTTIDREMPTLGKTPPVRTSSLENATFPDGHVKPSPKALTVVAWSFCRHPQFVATQLHTGLWTVRCSTRLQGGVSHLCAVAK